VRPEQLLNQKFGGRTLKISSPPRLGGRTSYISHFLHFLRLTLRLRPSTFCSTKRCEITLGRNKREEALPQPENVSQVPSPMCTIYISNGYHISRFISEYFKLPQIILSAHIHFAVTYTPAVNCERFCRVDGVCPCSLYVKSCSECE